MTDYKKPVVVGCDDVAEGVYAASGCYTVTTNIHQRPEFGRGDYRSQVKADEMEYVQLAYEQSTIEDFFNT